MAFKAEDGCQSKGGDFMMLQAPFPRGPAAGSGRGSTALQPGKQTQPHL